jgi:hypothetical protein
VKEMVAAEMVETMAAMIVVVKEMVAAEMVENNKNTNFS